MQEAFVTGSFEILGRDMEDAAEKPHVPTDIIFKIPAHISDPATLVRAASSHKLWRDIIKHPTFLDGLKRRHGDHGFTSSLLVGFVYQETTEAPSHLWQHHEDKSRWLAPSFISTSEFVPFRCSKEGCNAVDPMFLATFHEGIGASLNFYQPVASQDFLSLCYRSQDEEGRDMPDELCVCNPICGELFQIPNRRREAPPQHYVLLVTDDVGLDGRMSRSFRLVSIWINGKKFIYKYYCSNSRAWWKPTNVPELMPGHYLMSSPVADSNGGGIHWLCGSWKSMAPAYLCTLNMGQEELLYVELPPDAKSNKVPLLLASSADGSTLLLLVKGLQMSLWKHRNESGNDSANWVLSEIVDMTCSLPPRVQIMKHRAKLRLGIFRGKSGAVIWIDGEDLYLFFHSDRSMRKIGILLRSTPSARMRLIGCPALQSQTLLLMDGSMMEGKIFIADGKRWWQRLSQIIHCLKGRCKYSISEVSMACSVDEGHSVNCDHYFF